MLTKTALVYLKSYRLGGAGDLQRTVVIIAHRNFRWFRFCRPWSSLKRSAPASRNPLAHPGCDAALTTPETARLL
jgi:hypothetical protein